jgi:hypothetical protein
MAMQRVRHLRTPLPVMSRSAADTYGVQIARVNFEHVQCYGLPESPFQA